MADLFTRSILNPVLKPNPSIPWMSKKVYNPAAVFHKGKYHLFFRAVGDDWVSRIGHAVSKDGEKFEVAPNPVFEVLKNESRGHEDPRITRIGNDFVMVFGAYDGVSVRLHTAWSRDLYEWERKGEAIKDFDFIKTGGSFVKFDSNKNIIESKTSPKGELARIRSKSGGIFPQKINNLYIMLFGEFQMFLSTSKDGVNWDTPNAPFLSKREGNYFDNAFVEMGPQPIKTEKGWLVLYHGVNTKHEYSLGYLLLDLNDPTKILYRSEKPILTPQMPYELKGLVDVIPGSDKINFKALTQKELEAYADKAAKEGKMPSVVFVCGAINQGDNLRIYYGASDTWICTATAKISGILENKHNN